MRKGFEEQIHKFNKENVKNDKIELISFVAGEGRKGIVTQVQQMNQALAKNPDAIVIQPTDNSALAEGLQAANAKKIPVIAYDQYIVNGSLTAFLTSANYHGGRDNGDYLDSIYSKDQSVRIAVFEYPAVSSTTERVDGFFDSLRSHGRKFEVVGRYQAVDPDSGKEAVKKFLKDFPAKGSVDAILTVNDGGGLSVVKELVAQKRTEIKHFTFDGDPESIENLKAGKLTVIDSAQFCAELGRESARTLTAVLRGQTVERKIRVPTFPITEKSLKNYQGWLGVPTPELRKGLEKAPVKVTRLMGDNKNQKQILRIGTTPLCPYICEKSPGLWTGYLFDILGEVSRDLNVELRLENVPSSRLVQYLESRRVDSILVPEFMVRYLSNIAVVGPQLGVNYTGALVANKSTHVLLDHQALQNMKGVYSDFGTGMGRLESEFSALKLNKLTGADVADRMIRVMLDHRADVALGDYNVLRYSMAAQKVDQLKLVPTSLTGFSFLVLVGLPKNNNVRLLGDGLEQWFAESRKNAHLESILKKYNLVDWDILTRD